MRCVQVLMLAGTPLHLPSTYTHFVPRICSDMFNTCGSWAVVPHVACPAMQIESCLAGNKGCCTTIRTGDGKYLTHFCSVLKVKLQGNLVFHFIYNPQSMIAQAPLAATGSSKTFASYLRLLNPPKQVKSFLGHMFKFYMSMPGRDEISCSDAARRARGDVSSVVHTSK